MTLVCHAYKGTWQIVTDTSLLTKDDAYGG